MKSIFGWGIALCALALFFFRFASDFDSIKIVDPAYSIWVAIGMAISILLNGILSKVLLNILNVQISMREATNLSLLNVVGNILLPLRAGTVSSAVVLNRKHRVDIADFVGLNAAIYIVSIGLNALVGLFIAISALDVLVIHRRELIVGFALLTGGVIVLAALPYLPIFSLSLFDRMPRVQKVLGFWPRLASQPSILLMVAGLCLLQLLLAAGMGWAETRVFGVSIQFKESMVLGIFGSLSSLINLTPANLGVREWTMAAVAGELGLSPVLLFGASLFERAITLGLALIGYLVLRSPTNE